MGLAMTITFSDKEVSYDKFLNDLALRVVNMMKNESAKPEYVSQREASRLFGRANVERWRKNGQIDIIKRPGKIEYRYTELKRLYEERQDYLS